MVFNKKASAEAAFKISESVVIDTAYHFMAKPVLFSAAFYSACCELKLISYTVPYTEYLIKLEKLGLITSARTSYSDSKKYSYRLLGFDIKEERRKFSENTLRKLTSLKDEIVRYLTQRLKEAS